MMGIMDKILLLNDRDYDYEDVLLLGGGSDINPMLYGEFPHPRAQASDDRRDASNKAVITQAIRDKKPIIGVCRGLQMLNVYFGGSLEQHINNTSHVPIVDIAYAGRSDRFVASASHHQAVKRLGRFGVVIGTSDNPFIVQAVYWPEHNALGVQWHPEYMERDDDANVWLESFINELMVK